jgi:uncharacterized caspase-like protein
MIKRALVIGINEYENFESLDSCVKDARAISELLESHGGDHADPNFTVKTLLSSELMITQAVMNRSVRELFEGDDPDVAMLYFSGHGFKSQTGGKLVTQDAEKDDYGFSMRDVIDYATQSKIRNKVIILDCCHAGDMGLLSSVTENISQLPHGITILAASRSSEKAKEVLGQSVFTGLLINALNGGAANIVGEITLMSIYAYIEKALDAFDQRPVFRNSISRVIPLRHVPPKIQKRSLNRITEYFDYPEAKHKLDPEYEPSEGHGNKAKETIFSHLQEMARAGLVVPLMPKSTPLKKRFLYYAAIQKKSCGLTELGKYYWMLVDKNRY